MSEYLKFVRGDVNNYLQRLSSDASFGNYLFFDTSNHVMYLDGNTYGITSDEKDTLDELANGCFVSVTSTFDTSNESYSLVFHRFGESGGVLPVQLFGIKSGSSVIDVSYDIDTSCYDIDLNVSSSSDNIITKTAGGLFASLSLDVSNGRLVLENPETGLTIGSGVDLTSLLTEKSDVILSDVSIQENPQDSSGITHAGENLVFTFKDSSGNDLSGESIYLNINSLFNITYKGFNGIGVDNVTGDVSLLLLPSDKYLEVDSSGNLNTGNLDADIIDLSTRLRDLSVNGYDRDEIIGKDSDKWNNSDPSAGDQTLWAVKNYVDDSINNISGVEMQQNGGETVVLDASQESGKVTQMKTLFGNMRISGFNDMADSSGGISIEDGDSLNTILKKIQYAMTWDSLS